MVALKIFDVLVQASHVHTVYIQWLLHWQEQACNHTVAATWTPLLFIQRQMNYNNFYYYMASSVSGQDETDRALWMATRVGKMEPSSPLGTTCCIPHEKSPQKPYNKSFIDQVCSVKMVGYWPRSFFASLCMSTSSWSINTQKENMANIQPSWAHTWSITHTYNRCAPTDDTSFIDIV